MDLLLQIQTYKKCTLFYWNTCACKKGYHFQFEISSLDRDKSHITDTKYSICNSIFIHFLVIYCLPEMLFVICIVQDFQDIIHVVDRELPRS